MAWWTDVELIPLTFDIERNMIMGILQSIVNNEHRWKVYRTKRIAKGAFGCVDTFDVMTLTGEHVDSVAIKQEHTQQLDEYVAHILGTIHTCPSIRIIHLPLHCTGKEDMTSGYTMMTLMDGSLDDLIKKKILNHDSQIYIMYQLASMLQ